MKILIHDNNGIAEYKGKQNARSLKIAVRKAWNATGWAEVQIGTGRCSLVDITDRIFTNCT